jgi:hypothetical protein
MRYTLVYLLILPILVTAIAGFYPAVRLSRFQPAKTLKSGMSASYSEGIMLRRGLIIFQLFISQSLVIITIVITQQINHFMAQPIGLNSEAVVGVSFAGKQRGDNSNFKRKIVDNFRRGERNHEQYRIYFRERLGR